MRTVSEGRTLLLTLAAVAALGVLAPRPAHAFAFPVYSKTVDPENPASRETWVLWPFGHFARDEQRKVSAVHPFWSSRTDLTNGNRSVHVLWPLIRWTYEPETRLVTEKTRLNALILWHSRSERRDGIRHRHRFLFPLYWAGSQEDQGRYFVLFPFVWYARNAEIFSPIFPKRPQTFTSLWPLFGHFKGFWNRDKIFFILWPLFVRTTSHADAPDSFAVTSVLWPVFSVYSGENIGGFKAWPLFARVTNKDKWLRSYWLWPLGRHYRTYGERPSTITFFLPFFARARTPGLQYDLLFPFKGELRMKGRRTRGWALASYNQDDDLRRGIRKHRILWFLIRWTTNIPRGPEFAGSQLSEPLRGGGVFPLYLDYHTSTKRRVSILWPFIRYRRDNDHDALFRRTYFFPVYLRQRKVFHEDDAVHLRHAFFPFYRHWTERDGEDYRSIPHLWFYTRNESIDRNWAPLWTFWERYRNPESGEGRTRLLKGLWVREQNRHGVVRNKLNLLFFTRETYRGRHRPPEHHTRLLWGLAGYHRLGDEKQWELLGRRL